MNDMEMVAAIKDFERRSPILDYRIADQYLWSYLRNLIWYRLSAPWNVGHATRKPSSILQRYAGQVVRAGRSLVIRERPLRTDFVIVSYANRAVRLGARKCNMFAASLVDLLGTVGVSSDVWIIDKADRTCLPKHMQFDLRWDSLRRKVSGSVPSIAGTKWVRQVAQWTSELGIGFQTEELQNRIHRVLVEKEVWKIYLEESGCSAVLVDVWYGLKTIPLVMAASELGVVTSDVQHGLQGAGHPAYAGWDVAPQEGFSGIPTFFWVWGSQGKRDILANNGIVSEDQVVVGGNPWLNMWRDRKVGRRSEVTSVSSEVGKSPRKVVLITLQPGTDWAESLIPLISKAPPEWQWYVRRHRIMKEQVSDIEERLCSSSGVRNVNVRQASELPLYELMNRCTWHVTWYSTCAMEALAFGKPTILLHKTGTEAYARFIDDAVMYAAHNADDVIGLIQREKPDPGRCRRASESTFAHTDASHDAIRRIVDVAHRRRNNTRSSSSPPSPTGSAKSRG
jgi:hypothetical protein